MVRAPVSGPAAEAAVIDEEEAAVFGLSWGQIIIILLVGMFVLGPERIPVAVQWTVNSLKKVRTMAQGAQAQLTKEIGPELDEMRRQIAELQSLKEMQELRGLRDLHPRRLIGKGLLGPEGSETGGIGGFLGIDKNFFNPLAPDAVSDGSSVPGVGGVDAPALAVDLPVGSTDVAPAAAVDELSVSAARPVRPLDSGERPPFDPDGT